MFLDFEENQLKDLYEGCKIFTPVLLTGNSFEKKIAKSINSFDKIINNSGHNCNPPDFYSNELNIMFDIYRVNDSEIKKSYNPTAIAERKIEKEVQQSWITKIDSQAINKLIVNDKDWDSDKIHQIQYYIKNIKRVTEEHLSSKGHPNKIKDIWMREHPTITHKGLIIYDETENYFQGYCIPSCLDTSYKYHNSFSEKWLFILDKTKPLILYKPWLDKNIMQPIYDSDCDFIIWFMPNKYTKLIKYTTEGTYPTIIIIDTRFYTTNLIEYNYSKFTRT